MSVLTEEQGPIDNVADFLIAHLVKHCQYENIAILRRHPLQGFCNNFPQLPGESLLLWVPLGRKKIMVADFLIIHRDFGSLLGTSELLIDLVSSDSKQPELELSGVSKILDGCVATLADSGW